MKIKQIMLMAFVAPLTFAAAVNASAIKQTKGDFEDKFRQLDEVLPTPNVYRNAAGEPGEQYWQQKVDYDIKVSLDEENVVSLPLKILPIKTIHLISLNTYGCN